MTEVKKRRVVRKRKPTRNFPNEHPKFKSYENLIDGQTELKKLLGARCKARKDIGTVQGRLIGFLLTGQSFCDSATFKANAEEEDADKAMQIEDQEPHFSINLKDRDASIQGSEHTIEKMQESDH